MLGARATRFGRALVTIVTGAILWTSIATVALAADKTFSAAFVGSSALDAGASYGTGRAVFQLRLTNTSTQARFGSANVSAPTGVALTGASMASGSPGTATLNGAVIEMRNMDLAPGAQAVVNVSAKIECKSNVDHVPYNWTIVAKQANDFNGTGNDLTQVGTLVNSIAGQCHVAWLRQPASSEKAPTAITSKIYDPQGASVAVVVLSGDGSQTVTWWDGQIRLDKGDDPSVGGAAVLTGRGPTTTTNGIATFAPTLSLAASGYSLTATAIPNAGPSAGTLTTPLESNNFNIVDDADICVSANSTCDVESQGPKTKAVVEAAAGGAAGDLVILAFNDPAVTAPSCGSYVASSELIVFNVTTSDGTTASNRPKTATFTLAAEFVTKSASKYEVCFQGATGPAQLLAMCANRNPVLPCVVSKGLDKDKNLVIVVAAPGGDPKLNF